MTMKKYADGEGNAEVFRGKEAEVLNEHLSKTGKSLADFSDKERDSFHKDLDSVKSDESSEKSE